MTAEEETNNGAAPQKKRNLTPWLIALGAVLLYTITLNHWVTLGSLPLVSKISGWDWHPTYLDWRPSSFTPLLYLVTYPFRWLPLQSQPIGLNALSMVFAALTLWLLARSVALLPHDRTRDQRLRELSDNGLVSGRQAILPQLLAVLLCGLQITFWEHAVTATGEMLDLVIFAYLIRCLLEYRVSKKESWLTQFVLLYGIGVTNNYALIGFFPFFLVSVIWFKGLSFFKLKFIGRMAAFGCIGLLLYLVMPLVCSAASGDDFWHVLRAQLVQQKLILLSFPRWIPELLSFPTILALLFIGIRWPQFQGDISAIGSTVSNAAFHFMHLVFFAASVWIFLDIKFSPRVMDPNVAFLPFYYMAALSAGYFIGYLILVFGTSEEAPRFKPSPLQLGLMKGVRGFLVVFTIGIAGWLAWSNVPKIQAVNSPLLGKFAIEMARAVPQKGAIVLSDDLTHLELYSAACVLAGKPHDNILIETRSLVSPEYFRYLSKSHPQLTSLMPPLDQLHGSIDPVISLQMMDMFHAKGKLPIYYLHPSFGYYFERFYSRPNGLVSELIPYPQGVLEHPALTVEDVNNNQQFWKRLCDDELAAIPAQAKMLGVNSDAAVVAWFCSQALNCWGVELQKNSRIKEAAERFTQSLKFNPRNHMAQINLAFNAALREGNTQPINTTESIRDAIQEFRTWEAVLQAEGPADEPDLHLKFGQSFAAGNNLRQAFQLFQRRLVLRPNDFDALLGLAKTYADMHRYEKAEETADKASAQASSVLNKSEVLRIRTFIDVLQNRWKPAEDRLLAAVKDVPDDVRRAALLVEFYRMEGLNLLSTEKDEKPANALFAKALTASTTLLDLLRKTGKTGSAEESETLLKTAQLQIQLGQFDNAITTLSSLLQRQPDYGPALLNRAIAELEAKKFAAARRDYYALLKVVPDSVYAAYYGLTEIAMQEKDKAAALKNCRLYLKYAPKNSPEYKKMQERRAELER